MKLTYKQIEPFVASPNAKARVILIYGPDQGLMKERSQTIGKTVVTNLNDPFNVITLTTDKILSDPSLFYDEVNAQSLMGGDRLIIIKDGADSLAPYIKNYTDQLSQYTVVIIEAGDLNTRSALRKLCEGASNAVALPCYVDDERTTIQIIRDMCMHAGYSIDQDALTALSGAITGDRIIARNEVEKLILYKGIHPDFKGFSAEPVRERTGQISYDDVMACYGDVRDWSLDRLVYSVADGHIQESQVIIQSLLKDQMQPVTILRILQNHFWRLHKVRCQCDQGLSIEEAIKSLTPLVFWKVKDQFISQIQQWPLSSIAVALDALHQAEVKVKKTEYDAEAITKNVALQLSRYTGTRRAA